MNWCLVPFGIAGILLAYRLVLMLVPLFRRRPSSPTPLTPEQEEAIKKAERDYWEIH